MKITALMIAVLLLAACEPVQLPADYRLPNGAEYRGDTKDKLFDGQGSLTWPDGSVYEGQFSQGMMQGQGRLSQADGCVYEGHFTRGQPDGEGQLQCSDGVIYQGTFEQGKLVKGKVDYPDAGEYQGQLQDWQPEGSGVWTSESGDRYEGTFEEGEIIKGHYLSQDGEEYQGGFQYWTYHGQGVLTLPSGEQRRATFENGLAQGKGQRITGPEDQRKTETVYFLDGRIVDGPKTRAERHHQQAAELEQRLYSEGRRLQASLASLAPQRPGVRDIYLLAIGGDGRQPVFSKEVDWVAKQLGKQLDFRGRTLLLANGGDSQQPLATLTSISESLQALDQILDPSEDLLLIHLVSHGSRDGDVVLAEPGMRLNNLTVQTMAAQLDKLRIQHQWLVISACYSGQWIKPLANAQRVIFTSAAADRTSFGCSDDSERTWFSKALYGDALQDQGLLDLQALFAAADQQVEEMEKARDIEGDQHSLPQHFMGKAFMSWWRSQAVAMPQ
ncbi:hypothetical protein A11A3_10127 [Alcanivorax hongdengensis A-11-3]|uniref:Peptidase C13 n=1 Tax=Alcanivorax hongdengensis A-11-3 TaxID=1177179 RepID=L0WBL7_9GAMM|nr:C13 family peptidase [Alcanivorax hongdengensis]EKF74168.1 hypothetical protein A11A3_10127 [Alcanivorax hongdengensis A-11-3]